MKEFLNLLAFGAGAFCIGVAVAIALIFTLVGRNTNNNDGEGCLGKLITLIALAAGVAFFYLAIGGL